MKNIYLAHGGEELVVGGKVTILEGAEIEDRRGAPSAPEGAHAAPVADSAATTIAALRADHNALLAALREAGLIEAPDQ